MMPRAQAGLAVAPDRVVLHVGGVTLDERLDAGALDVDPRAALDAALARLLRRLPAPPSVVTIALAPALAEVHAIELPPLPLREARRAIARDPARHFATAGGDAVVAVEAGDSPGQIVAALARADLVAALREAAVAQRLHVRAVRPALTAWLHAAGDAATRVVIADAEETTVVARAGGRVASVARCRTANAARVRALIGDAAAETVRTIGDTDLLALAAAHVPLARGLDLVDAARERAGRRRTRRIAAGLAAAVVVLLVGLAAARIVYLRAELARAVDARARIARAVEPALVRAAAVRGAAERARAVDRLRREAPPWPERVAMVAAALPDDAHLTSLRAAGDSIVVAGQGTDAASVLLAMRAAPGVRAVRATAPFRQDVGPDGVPVERFTLTIDFVPAVPR